MMIKYKAHSGSEKREISPFVHDPFTWFAYLMLGYSSYLQAVLGPLAVIFLLKFHLSYTDTGIPTGAFAVGMILIGLCGEQIMRPWRRHIRLSIWSGGVGMVLGALLLMLSQNMLMVVISAFLMGACGTLLQFIVQAMLVDHHQEYRATALTEANVITGSCAGLAPLLVGGFQYVGLGWHAALFCAFGMLALTAVQFWLTSASAISLHLHHGTAQPVEDSGRLPLAFWLYWLVLVCSVAMEWSMIVWSAILLRNVGVASDVATTVVSLFFMAEVSGRFLGSRLTRFMKSSTLLLLTLGIIAPGFALFWLVPLPALKVVGLFLTGLGIANLYPLTLAVAISTTPQRAKAASARLLAGAGIAILGAPLVLGRIADAMGSVQQAFSLIVCLLVVAVIVTCCANYLAGGRGVPPYKSADSAECEAV